MSEFVLNKTIDTEKVFLIKLSEIDGRLDATSFKTRFKFVSDKYDTVKLNQIAFIDPQTTFSKLKPEEEISFFPMEAISDIDGEIIKHQTKKVSESKGYTRFKEGDLIWAKITPCMQNGKSAIVNNTLNGYACGSTEYYVIRPKENNILVEYIHILLRNKKILDSAQNFFGGSAGQQRVSKNFLLNFDVPIPPLELQKEIVGKIQVAKSLKKQKETQAKQLLGSIDEYLLNELGVTLPVKDDSLQNRIFKTPLSMVSGERFDPYFHQAHFVSFFENLAEVIFPVLSIKEISKKITSGITPLSGGDAYVAPDSGIPFIRSGNIDIDGDINFEDLLYLREDVHNNIMRSSKVLKNDIMIAIVGATIGQVGIYKHDCEANINQAIALVRLKNGFNVDYIKEVIKSSVGQYNLNRLKRPVARANINLEEISTMKIIVPPIDKQNEIAEHIREIREQAKQLQKEAVEELEKARLEIEYIILGEK